MRTVILLILALFTTSLSAREVSAEPLPADDRTAPQCANRYDLQSLQTFSFQQFVQDIESGEINSFVICLEPHLRKNALRNWASLLESYKQPRPARYYMGYLELATTELDRSAQKLAEHRCGAGVFGEIDAQQMMASAHSSYDSPRQDCIDAYRTAEALVTRTLHILRLARRTGALAGNGEAYLQTVVRLGVAVDIYTTLIGEQKRAAESRLAEQGREVRFSAESDARVLTDALLAIADAPELRQPFSAVIKRASKFEGPGFSGEQIDAASLRALVATCLEEWAKPDDDKTLNPALTEQCLSNNEPSLTPEDWLYKRWKASASLPAFGLQIDAAYALQRIGVSNSVAARDDFIRLYDFGRLKLLRKAAIQSKFSGHDKSLNYLGLLMVDGSFLTELQSSIFSVENYIQFHTETGGMAVFASDPIVALDAIDLVLGLARQAESSDVQDSRDGALYSLRVQETARGAAALKAHLTTVVDTSR